MHECVMIITLILVGKIVISYKYSQPVVLKQKNYLCSYTWCYLTVLISDDKMLYMQE